MTRNELKRRFPEATEDFIRRNLTPAAEAGSDHKAAVQLPAKVGAEPTVALVEGASGKTKGAGGCPSRYRVEWTLYAVKPLDYDNATGSIKELQDALVSEGWLPADDYLTLEGEARSVKVDHLYLQRVEVEIRRIK